jgi:hypothetical protein
VWEYARDQSFALYREAVRRGIIDGGQAEALMALWLERHVYEPLAAPITVTALSDPET